MVRSRLGIFVLLLTATVAGTLLSCGDENPQDPGDGRIDPGIDTIPPAAVTGLVAKSPTPSSLALQWISSGDDGVSGRASRYDIRYSASVITEQNWDAASPVNNPPPPKPAGEIQILVVGGLPSASEVYFAIKAYDEVDNESPLSNCPKGTTLNENQPPGPVANLRADATSDTEFLLVWIAPGDDGWLPGRASQYDIRYSTEPITVENWADADQATGEPAPKPTGAWDSCLVSGMEPNVNYYFGIKTADEIPNWSELSNNGFALAMSEYLLVEPRDITVGGITDTVYIMFRTRSETELCVINATRQMWSGAEVVFRHLVNGHFPAGSHYFAWDVKTDDGAYPTSWYAGTRIRIYLDGEELEALGIRFYDP